MFPLQSSILKPEAATVSSVAGTKKAEPEVSVHHRVTTVETTQVTCSFALAEVYSAARHCHSKSVRASSFAPPCFLWSLILEFAKSPAKSTDCGGNKSKPCGFFLSPLGGWRPLTTQMGFISGARSTPKTLATLFRAVKCPVGRS